MITHFFKAGSGFFCFLVYLLFFSVLLSSCTTTTSNKIDPYLLKDSDMMIDNAEYLVMKNGSFVPLTGKSVVLRKTYKNFQNVIVAKGSEAVKTVLDTAGKRYRAEYKEDIYPLDSVKEIYITKTETDAAGTVMVVVGSVLAAVLVLVILAAIELSNHPIHSCPFIYSFDGEKFVMDAEPLGGAVCEGLERTDVSKLENLKSTCGQFRVRLRNSNDEQQRIDKLDFVSVMHDENEYTAPDAGGKFWKFRNCIKPVYAVNETGFDVSGFISDRDGVRWFNELPYDTSQLNHNPKETLTIRFPKPDGVKNAMLVINGGASYFGSGMVPEMLKLNGNKVDELYKSVYPGSDMQKKLFNAMHRDESYYMDIKVNDGNEPVKQGIMKSNGPVAIEDAVYPLNLENNNSGFVEIVLTPQRYFWKFDMINITYDFEPVMQNDIKKLEMSYARDNYGNNLLSVLNSQNKDYYNMPVTGDYADIFLKVPEEYNANTSDIYVPASGWYEINLKKSAGHDGEQIERILFTPDGLYKYAIELYRNKLAGLTAEINPN